jgi:hypothetical protein
MPRYTLEQIARIRAESERLLRDDPQPAARPEPRPTPREVHMPNIDPVQEWRAWHDARDREREAAKAELRRPEHVMRTSERAAIDTLTAQVAALRRDHDVLAEAANAQARALIEFSNAVETKLTAICALAGRLERTFEEIKTAREQQITSLRNQLDLVGRQNAWLDEQLRTAQHEADVATGRREALRTREAVQRVADIIKLK